MKKYTTILTTAVLLFGLFISISQTFAQQYEVNFHEEEPDPEMVIKVYDVSEIQTKQLPYYPARKISDISGSDTIFPYTQPKLPHNYSGGGGMMCQFGGSIPRVDQPLVSDMDTIIDTITSTIAPNTWDTVGGPGSISPIGQRIIVSNGAEIQEKVGELLHMLKDSTDSRKNVTVEVDFVELPREQIDLLLEGEIDQSQPKIFGLVKPDEWKTVDPIYSSTLTGSNRQTVSTVSGGQRKTYTTIVPVVGDWSEESAETAEEESPQQPETISTDSPVLAQTFSSSSRSVGYQPVFAVIQTGWAVETTPIVMRDDSAALLDIRVRKVDEPIKPAKADPTNPVETSFPLDFEKPTLANWQFATTLRVPAGKRVLIGGMDSLYVFVKVTID